MRQKVFFLILLHFTTVIALFKHGTKKKYALFIPKEKKGDNYPSQASKKTDLLGQDTSKLDEQEFKLQSMVSPEFHSNQHFKNNFKQAKLLKIQVGSLDLEAMSPAEVSFIQSSSQWHKYAQPKPKEKLSEVNSEGTIFPEDPVPFPNEGGNKQGREWSDLVHEGSLSKSWSSVDKFVQQGEKDFKNYLFPETSPLAKANYVQEQLPPLKQRPIETNQDSIMLMGNSPLRGMPIVDGNPTGPKANNFLNSLMLDSSVSGSINGISKLLGSSYKGSILSSSNLSKLKKQPSFDTSANTRSHSGRRKNSDAKKTASKKTIKENMLAKQSLAQAWKLNKLHKKRKQAMD